MIGMPVFCITQKEACRGRRYDTGNARCFHHLRHIAGAAHTQVPAGNKDISGLDLLTKIRIDGLHHVPGYLFKITDAQIFTRPQRVGIHLIPESPGLSLYQIIHLITSSG
jgi:hypothetical protein